ncbi:MAG: hypothetical protein KGL39_47955, partial [Patescibacteria group bacterium]|nr:hypothetical protein [Patescibacteria group bacterium]
NLTLSFSQGTNQWLWQNRQGLAASPPTGLSSNETMTLSIAHLGGNTNWLAYWDTTVSTNVAGGSGLSTTNWTYSSGLGPSFALSTVYTNQSRSGLLVGVVDFGETNATVQPDSCTLYYTNSSGNGSLVIASPITYGGSLQGDLSVPFSIPLDDGGTFKFTPAASSTVYQINGTFWQLPH